MDYCPHTDTDIREMLDAVGVSSVDDLFEPVPEALRRREPLDLPPARSELELTRELGAIAVRNVDLSRVPSFLGGGIYDHFVPALIDHLVLRGEFLTAYTPYQAEASQGSLATIFEFQSLICELTGMEVANASMYDGASAAAEAVQLALSAHRGRTRVLVSAGLHPEAQRVLQTYRDGAASHELDRLPLDAELSLDAGAVAGAVTGEAVAEAVRAQGALLIVVADPVSLGLLEAPGAYGADVVVGDCQALGCPPSYGGPFAGYFASRHEHVRRMPGRIVGTTTDGEGRRGFVLTFQTREQHIRRARATSNICTNQALMALRATIYLAAMGPAGFGELARRCFENASYLRER
ncbi:MAG: aminomethyl-transferring glycine dehydrogenase subunit GcvPA, partial [Planctomycetota bacterium]